MEGAKANGVPKTFVQFFGDGRDTSPTSGGIKTVNYNAICEHKLNSKYINRKLIIFLTVKYVKQLLDHIASLQYGSLATLTGRYYAMDRDKRYERIKIAFEGLVQAKGEQVKVENVIKVAYWR